MRAGRVEVDDKGITRPAWWAPLEEQLLEAADAGWLTWRAQGSGRVYRVAEGEMFRRTVSHREGQVLAELVRQRVLRHEADEGFAYVNRQGRVVPRREERRDEQQVTYPAWLVERERFWRETIGDEAWEEALQYWRRMLTRED